MELPAPNDVSFYGATAYQRPLRALWADDSDVWVGDREGLVTLQRKGEFVARFDCRAPVNFVIGADDLVWIGLGSGDIWCVESSSTCVKYQWHFFDGGALCCALLGGELFCGGSDGRVCRLSKNIQELDDERYTVYWASNAVLGLSADDGVVAIVDQAGLLTMLCADLLKPRFEWSVPHDATLVSVVLLGTTLWLGAADGAILVVSVDIDEPRILHRFTAHNGPVTSLNAFDGEGVVWSTGVDCAVVAWDAETFASRCTVSHREAVLGLCRVSRATVDRLWAYGAHGGVQCYLCQARISGYTEDEYDEVLECAAATADDLRFATAKLTETLRRLAFAVEEAEQRERGILSDAESHCFDSIRLCRHSMATNSVYDGVAHDDLRQRIGILQSELYNVRDGHYRDIRIAAMEREREVSALRQVIAQQRSELHQLTEEYAAQNTTKSIEELQTALRDATHESDQLKARNGDLQRHIRELQETWYSMKAAFSTATTERDYLLQYAAESIVNDTPRSRKRASSPR